ncbi:carbohydrate kinase [Acidiferrimicrobium sp. IK]|uniref:carbohydrate kinase family protein n=1 Tax=Acidiferrimicrobium sp. IK TaxID=2871700 RepID=UPI0021CB7B24|nr:carbohydrate kinase [Acidiferrimicrobium sp. IK]MCU4186078.1 carbohydrate kinase [Acidiferrimicrobium sp. IK]
MIVVCGEALVDFVPRPDGLWEARPGGAPANVARTLSALGAPTVFLGGLSSDGFGRMLRAHLEDAGVDVSRCPPALQATALAVADTTHADVTYTFYVEGTATFAAVDRAPAATSALYVGGLGTIVEPMATALYELLADLPASAIRMYDPNVRPAFVAGIADYRDQVERWIGRADVIKASESDIQFLYPGAPFVEVAGRWMDLGASLVAVTRGAAGSEAFTAGARADVEAAPVDATDAIGAGDAFSAGLLQSLAGAGHLDRHALAAVGVEHLAAHLRAAGAVAASHLRQGARR